MKTLAETEKKSNDLYIIGISFTKMNTQVLEKVL